MIYELTSYLTSWFFGMSVFSQICVILLSAFVPLYIISYVGNKILRRRRKNNNPELWQYLDTYLEMKKPGFAVFINGGWGSGKTYFIKHYLAPHNLFKMPCYLSLFGVNSRSEFNFRMWKAILSTKIKIAVMLCVLLVSGLMALGLGIRNYSLLRAIDFWSLVIPTLIGALVFIWSFIHLFARDLMLRFRYLVLDDFERAGVDYPILMAWISELVEHRCCPVIIIGNEHEILKKLNSDNRNAPMESAEGGRGESSRQLHVESFACEQYKCMKEKVIGKEFFLGQNDILVIKALTSELPRSASLRKILNDNTDWFISEILNPLHRIKLQTNYRALEHVMHNFCWHFSTASGYVENEKIWKALIPRYFSVMYCKEIGELFNIPFTTQDAKELFSFGSCASAASKKLVELYPCWGSLQSLLSEYVWIALIENEVFDFCYMERDFDSFLYAQNSLLSEWHFAYDLDDAELESLINKTNDALFKHKIHSPKEIMLLADAMMDIQEVCDICGSIDHVNELFNNYIEIEVKSGKFVFGVLNRDYYNSEKRAIERIGQNKPSLNKIRQKLLKETQDAFSCGLRSMFYEMLNTLKSKDKTALADWFNTDNHNEVDIYSGNEPQLLWDALDKTSTAAFNEAFDAFQIYLIDFKNDLINLSLSGFKFWNEFVSIALHYQKQWSTTNSCKMKNFRTGYFIEQVKPLLDQYAKSKNITRQGENNGQDEV